MNGNNLLKPFLRDVCHSEHKFRKNLVLKYLGKSTPYNTFPSQALYLPKFVLPIMRPVYVKKHTMSTK
jgi:hypothetical protein